MSKQSDIGKENKMKLENISANFLGDSITEGHGTTGQDKTFHQLIAKRYGMKTARNYGIGGTRFARQGTASVQPIWDRNFCDRFSEMDDDAQLVVVFGGTNDFGHGDAPLGSFADREPITFYGACHYLMSGLLNKYPESRIVIMTPLHRCNEDNPKGDGNKAYNVAPLSEYVRIIKEVAEYYSLPVLDLWACSGIQPKAEVIKRMYCPDGLHPNDAGHARLAEVIGNYLLNL